MSDATPAAAGLARERAARRTVSRDLAIGCAVLVCAADVWPASATGILADVAARTGSTP